MKSLTAKAGVHLGPRWWLSTIFMFIPTWGTDFDQHGLVQPIQAPTSNISLLGCQV